MASCRGCLEGRGVCSGAGAGAGGGATGNLNSLQDSNAALVWGSFGVTDDGRVKSKQHGQCHQEWQDRLSKATALTATGTSVTLHLACVLCQNRAGGFANVSTLLKCLSFFWLFSNSTDTDLIFPKSIKHTKTANQSTPQGSLQLEQQALHSTFMNPDR